MAHDATHDWAQDRVTIQEAARRLGVKDDAVRKRIQRGTLSHEKGGDGRVYVYLDAAQDKAHDAGEDATQAEAQAGTRDATGDRGELVEAMRDEIHHLRAQLEEEREARRRADTIIVQLSQATAEQARTIRAIEPAQDAGADAAGEEVHDAGADAQTGSRTARDDHRGDRRPWWKRLFS